MTSKVIIGTRGSELALWQSRETQRLLGVDSELHVIRTSGDNFQSIPLQGGVEQGFFTRDIEMALLDGAVDIAVHSLKDLPTVLASGLDIGACLERAPVSDLLLIHPAWHDPTRMLPLRDGCVVGATSLRRQALLRLFAPHCMPKMLRGNVPGRVKKCLAEEFGAIVLARAGVGRLELDTGNLIVCELQPDLWIPAPGQGAIAIQFREKDSEIRRLLSGIDHGLTRQAVSLERQLLANYEGGCHTAFGAWARNLGSAWTVHLGMELESGWGMYSLNGGIPELERIGPTSMIQFLPRFPDTAEDLCKPVVL